MSRFFVHNYCAMFGMVFMNFVGILGFRPLHNSLSGTIWLSFNLPCQTNKGHKHSKIVMVYPPVK
jgi:hypothetical protein